MGTAMSRAANGLGVVLGNAFAAPMKTIFGGSCEGICSSTWDLICFLEHLCISNILKLVMVSILVYIIILFCYLLFEVGILQCIGRSLCKMTWAACEAYWTALEEIGCFLCHKIKHAKRVRRHRFKDLEKGLSSTDDDSETTYYSSVRVTRKQRSVRDRRGDHIQKSLHPTRHSSKIMTRSGSSRHHLRLKTRQVSVHLKGSGRMRNTKQIQLRSRGNHSRKHMLKKRRGR